MRRMGEAERGREVGMTGGWRDAEGSDCKRRKDEEERRGGKERRKGEEAS